MSTFVKGATTGAVHVANVYYGAAWANMEKHIKSDKTREEFESFKFSIIDSVSSSLLPNVIKKEQCFAFGMEAKEEEIVREDLNLQNYLDASNFVKYYINNHNDVLEVGSPNKERFSCLLSGQTISFSIRAHVKRLRKLNSIHQMYVFQRAVAGSDLVECGDGMRGLLKQLNCEMGWPELPRDNIIAALTQNLALLHKLKEDKEFISSVSESRTSELRTRLLKMIEEKYSEELCEYAKESNKLRIVRCQRQRNMENVLMKRSVEAEAAGLKYLPEEFSLPRHSRSIPFQLSLHPQRWKIQSIMTGALLFVSFAGWNAKRLKKIMISRLDIDN